MTDTTTHLITIPPGDELDFTVADDVDDEGRTYTRCVEGPAEIPVERWDDPFRRTEHWDTGDGLIISVDDVEDSWVTPAPGVAS